LDEIFTYHAPNEKQVGQYARINEATKAYAKVLLEECPSGRELSIALTDLQLVRMTANMAIAVAHIE
jgi:hypothetical protein